MARKVFPRALLGVPLGVAIGYVISIFISAVVGDGAYYPCVPELVETTGSELNAVTTQTALSGLLGAVFGGASVVWQIDGWSLARQTGVYFAAASLGMLPVAWFAYWMEHSVVGFLRYFGIFALIFAAVWVVEILAGRRSVRKMNARLPEERSSR